MLPLVIEGLSEKDAAAIEVKALEVSRNIVELDKSGEVVSKSSETRTGLLSIFPKRWSAIRVGSVVRLVGDSWPEKELVCVCRKNLPVKQRRLSQILGIKKVDVREGYMVKEGVDLISERSSVESQYLPADAKKGFTVLCDVFILLSTHYRSRRNVIGT